VAPRVECRHRKKSLSDRTRRSSNSPLACSSHYPPGAPKLLYLGGVPGEQGRNAHIQMSSNSDPADPANIEIKAPLTRPSNKGTATASGSSRSGYYGTFFLTSTESSSTSYSTSYPREESFLHLTPPSFLASLIYLVFLS